MFSRAEMRGNFVLVSSSTPCFSFVYEYTHAVQKAEGVALAVEAQFPWIGGVVGCDGVVWCDGV